MVQSNQEVTVKCPYCSETMLRRGLHAHVFQSDDSRHNERYEVPEGFDVSETEVVGEEEVILDYPDNVDLGDEYFLDTYTGKAYEGRRGLMIHLSAMAGQHNIPEDIADRHDADDFPQVKIDDDGNITELVTTGENGVPPVEPYLPWFTDEEEGYISKREINEFVEEIEDAGVGAASVDTIINRLLKQ